MVKNGIILKINNTLKEAYIFYNMESETLLTMEFSIMYYF